MKLWVRKLIVAVVAVVTLGIYVPPLEITDKHDENSDSIFDKLNSEHRHEQFTGIAEDETVTESKTIASAISFSKDRYISQLTEQAKEQALTKFGPRVKQRVEDEFMVEILPEIEKTITELLENVREADVTYYEITENPTAGLGERIFNLADARSGEAIAKFHVRRDNRPLEGYWFNFHYHDGTDNFETHHTIGEVYWDKNVPPRWMA